MSNGKQPFSLTHPSLDKDNVNLTAEAGQHFDKHIYGSNKDDFHTSVVEPGMEAEIDISKKPKRR